MLGQQQHELPGGQAVSTWKASRNWPAGTSFYLLAALSRTRIFTGELCPTFLLVPGGDSWEGGLSGLQQSKPGGVCGYFPVLSAPFSGFHDAFCVSLLTSPGSLVQEKG